MEQTLKRGEKNRCCVLGGAALGTVCKVILTLCKTNEVPPELTKQNNNNKKKQAHKNTGMALYRRWVTQKLFLSVSQGGSPPMSGNFRSLFIKYNLTGLSEFRLTDRSHLHRSGAKTNEKIAQEQETADCLCEAVKVCLPDAFRRSEGCLCFSRLIYSLRRTANYNRGFGWSARLRRRRGALLNSSAAVCTC